MNARQNRKRAAGLIQTAMMLLTKANKASAAANDHDTVNDTQFVVNYLDSTLKINALKAERAGHGL